MEPRSLVNKRIFTNRSMSYLIFMADSLSTHAGRKAGFPEANDTIPIEGLSIADLMSNGRELEANAIAFVLLSTSHLFLHLVTQKNSHRFLNKLFLAHTLQWFNRAYILIPLINTARILAESNQF